MAQPSIQSVLLEERTFQPPPDFVARSQLQPAALEALYARAKADPTGFWADLARNELHWHRPFTQTLDDSQAPNYRWFADGQLNVSWNCLDVHLEERGHKTAIIFEGEPGETRKLSYRELHAEVCRFANVLKSRGIETGDRVVIYMPLVPEIVIAMLACARIGAIHSVVFGGFSAPSLKDRIEDAGAKLLITADGGKRGGHTVELKAAADKALAGGCPTIREVIVFQRTGEPVHMEPGRDVWWHEVIEGQSPVCDPVWVDAEHPLFLLYTSGSTGKPKGIQHSSAGYLLGAKTTAKWVFDLRDDDVFWCTADVGWVTGHSYVAYGPMANGATVVLYEGAPTYPDGGRFWKICQTHGVTIFYTAPTAIRALMKLGDAIPAQYDLSRLRLLGSVGEPINPEAWMWYQKVIGGGRCPIVDTWWQTETGAIMIAPIPSVTATKPGSCTKPLPGIEADIVDDHGDSVTRLDTGGYLVIRRPWPAMLRTIWGDNARYLSTYWEKFQNRFYVAGDSAHRDKDGYFWIMGRIDDVLNVAGHRLGTMEIESALVSHPRVAEAAVVGRPHEIKGEAVFAYVVCREHRPTAEEAVALTKELREWVAQELGPIARPDDIRFADNLPKTRSGKIMRRLLRSIARDEEITQDVSTLENPAILDQLRGVEAAGSASAGTQRPSNAPPRAAKADVAAKKKAATARTSGDGERASKQTSPARHESTPKPAAAAKKATGKAAAKATGPKGSQRAPAKGGASSGSATRATAKRASAKRTASAAGSKRASAARTASAARSKQAVATRTASAAGSKRASATRTASAARSKRAAAKTAARKRPSRRPAPRKVAAQAKRRSR
ncbi:MAG TPA: acetate--CoA ligase [Steroidobacteraceae bacterium]|nr:acetate--CoA ligase [Steroidobacteraceae bacterium]